MRVSKTVEHKRAAFPGLVCFFKDFLIDRPEFDASNKAFQDASRDPEFNARLRTFMEQQIGYETLVMIFQKPHVRAHHEAIVSPDKTKELLVDEETISDYATRFVAIAMMASQVRFSEIQKQRLREKIVVAVSQFILDHPEYNSYGTFDNLRDSEECKLAVAEVLTEFLEEQGMLSD